MVSKALTAFGVIIAALVGLYLVLWALFDSAKTAAAVMVTIVLMSLGYVAGHIQWRHRDTTQPIIYTHDGDAPVRQLPEPARFVRTAENTYINRDVLQDDARKVLELRDAGYPAPRRALIENVLQTNDHERIARTLDYLASCGYVTPARDGQAREWIQDE